MPCYCPEPTEREKEFERVTDLLRYVNTKLNLNLTSNYIGENGRRPDFSQLDNNTAKLCSIVRSFDEDTLDAVVYNGRIADARKLAEWWEKHKKFDESEGRGLKVTNKMDKDGSYIVKLYDSSLEDDARKFSEPSIVDTIKVLNDKNVLRGVYVELGDNIPIFNPMLMNKESYLERFKTIDLKLACGRLKGIVFVHENQSSVIYGRFTPVESDFGNIAKILIESGKYKFWLRGGVIENNQLVEIITFDLLPNID